MTVFSNKYLRINQYKAERALILIRMATMGNNTSPPDIYDTVGNVMQMHSWGEGKIA